MGERGWFGEFGFFGLFRHDCGSRMLSRLQQALSIFIFSLPEFLFPFQEVFCTIFKFKKWRGKIRIFSFHRISFLEEQSLLFNESGIVMTFFSHLMAYSHPYPSHRILIILIILKSQIPFTITLSSPDIIFSTPAPPFAPPKTLSTRYISPLFSPNQC